MRLLTRIGLAAVLSAGLAQMPETACARHERRQADPSAPPHLVQSLAADRRISLEQAIDSVQRATGGRVLDAKDLGDQYRIKVLTRRGEVRVVIVDARTGAMSQ